MSTCLSCGQRFKRRPDQSGFCEQHNRELLRNGAAEKRRKTRMSWRHNLYKVVHWRGLVIGLYEKPGDSGKVVPRAINVPLEQLPKGKLINLDEYCPGFERLTIKKLKAAVLQACEA